MARAPAKSRTHSKSAAATRAHAAGRSPAVAAPGDASIVDRVTDRIAFAIASGVHAPGERLPSVRALALEHGINPSTVQIVMSRLRESGFVDVAQGSGFLVRDIELYGGIDTFGYIFRFAQRLPARATRLFESFLATRRVLVIEVVRAIMEEPNRFDLRPLESAIERLEVLAESGASAEEFARAELHAARLFMRQVDQPVLLALYNTLGEILLTIPSVVSAMYAEPTFNAGMWRELIDAWKGRAAAEGDLELASSALTAFHETCVARFRAILAQR